MIPIIAALLQANNQQAQQQQAAGNSQQQQDADSILNKRLLRQQAQQQVQPRGQIGIGGMTLPGDGMARQDQVFQNILAKYGQRSALTGGQWSGLNYGGGS